ncbi:MAG: uroporphyrinogen decarboxylase family protein [Candidatus Omnitrophota bacterium]
MGKAQGKIERMRLALLHKEGDRIPAGEFFWTGFMKRCREKWGDDFDPYRHFDLDYVVITPNMDPRIQPFEIVKQEGDDVWVKTGFGAVIRRSGEYPMPSYESFSINHPDEMADFTFDDPADSRRFYSGGDDQINGVGDALLRNLPAWNERLKPYVEDFAVFGSVCEPFEYLWRIVGSENAMIWLATAPEALADFVHRIGAFMLTFARTQIEAGQGMLSGMYIWGDVAYHKGMLFGLQRWRDLFKPHVKALIDLIHSRGLMAVYHGCGDSRALLGDLAELGLDAFNPVEAKAGMDAVELKKKYSGKLAFIGNIDIRALESNDPEIIRRETLYKLQAARGGGWVFQSDHSVSSAVLPESYEYAIRILREYGNYPLTIR